MCIYFAVTIFENTFLCVCCVCIFVSSLGAGCLQKRQVMVTSFGCFSDGKRAPKSRNRWRSCRVQRKMGEGEMEEDRDTVIEVEGLWILDGMGDVELHEGGHWDVGFCTGVGGIGRVGGSADVGGTDGVVSVRSGDAGSGGGDSDSGVIGDIDRGLLETFQPEVGCRKHVCGCVSLSSYDLIFLFFGFF